MRLGGGELRRLWLYHVQISGLLLVICELEYVTDGMANTRDIWHKVLSIGRRHLLSPDSRLATYCQQLSVLQCTIDKTTCDTVHKVTGHKGMGAYVSNVSDECWVGGPL